MSGRRIIKDRNYMAQYYATILRMVMRARIATTDGNYPWEQPTWLEAYPRLSQFLIDDSMEFETQEQLQPILHEFYQVANDSPWLYDAVRDCVERDLKQMVPKAMKQPILSRIRKLATGMWS